MNKHSKKFRLWAYNFALESANDGMYDFYITPSDTTLTDPDIIILDEVDITCPPIPPKEEMARQSQASRVAGEVKLKPVETKRAKRRAIAFEEGGKQR